MCWSFDNNMPWIVFLCAVSMTASVTSTEIWLQVDIFKTAPAHPKSTSCHRLFKIVFTGHPTHNISMWQALLFKYTNTTHAGTGGKLFRSRGKSLALGNYSRQVEDPIHTLRRYFRVIVILASCNVNVRLLIDL